MAGPRLDRLNEQRRNAAEVPDIARDQRAAVTPRRRGDGAVGRFQAVAAADIPGLARQVNVERDDEQGSEQLLDIVLVPLAQFAAAEQFEHGNGGDVTRRSLVENLFQGPHGGRIAVQIIDDGVGIQRIHGYPRAGGGASSSQASRSASISRTMASPS